MCGGGFNKLKIFKLSADTLYAPDPITFNAPCSVHFLQQVEKGSI